MYERSRNVLDCHIAGFIYYDGLDVVDKLTLGASVGLQAEPDNPYDPEAVAIFYESKKIGFIPKDKNSLISLLLHFGHTDILEARIVQIDHQQHPERQYRLVVKLKDKRDTKAREAQIAYEALEDARS